MTTLLFWALILCGVYAFLRKKRPSGPGPEPAPLKITLMERSEAELDERRARYDALLQGPHGAVLARCREKVIQMFIPKPNGDFKGSLSGILYDSDRAKRLAKIDEAVLPLLGGDAETYELWWTTLYDEVLNLAAEDTRLGGFVRAVLADVGRGDALLAEAGVWEQLRNPDGAEHKIKISTPDGTLKIRITEKHGRPYHEIKGAYELFQTGLSFDPLVRSAEMLMAVSGLFRGTQKTIFHEEVVWHAVPSLSKLNA